MTSYTVKDSSCNSIETSLDSQILDLLIEILGKSAATKLLRALKQNAIVEPGVTRKLLLNNLNSELGLTPLQLSKLKAVVELGRQLFLPIVRPGRVVDSPEVASALMNRMIGHELVEHFCVLVVDVKHVLLATEVISVGTATETLANPRDVFRCVLRLGGTRCIVGHNHPSGSLEESEQDLALTGQLINAGNCMDIPVLDHIIVSQGRFKSLRQNSKLWESQLV